MERSISTSNDELITVREGMRNMHHYILELEAGTVEKFVLTRQGIMVAVLLSLDDYVELAEKAKAIY